LQGSLAWAQQPLSLYTEVVGSETRYRIEAGDTLNRLAKKLGLPSDKLAAINAITDPRRLRVGSSLLVSTRRIPPLRQSDGPAVVINVAERRLYWFNGAELRDHYPVAVGKPGWATPTGSYHVTGRRMDPVWHVPISIQREMRSQGREVKKTVPPGPDNPLGRFWISLSASNLGLHGTNRNDSLGRLASHGCIRLPAAGIEKLYEELPVGTPVHITNEPIKFARTVEGRVFLEVHPDPYATAGDARPLPQDVAVAAGISLDEVDWESARRVMSRAWGIATEVTAERSERSAPAT
jgi:L,D-transpeptidase ErfK/SrfK